MNMTELNRFIDKEHISKPIEERMAELEQLQNIIRVNVDNVYDIQKERIRIGNRISQSFIRSAGVKPTQSLDTMDGEIKTMISKLVKECSLITDTYIKVFDNKGRIDKAIEYLGEDLFNIKNALDYQMIDIYLGFLKQEAAQVKIVDKLVKQHPMWDAFFKNVEGCGPLMSAVCLSRLNPFKARHASSFHKYAGLDVVWTPYKESTSEKMFTKHVHIVWDDDRNPYDAYVIDAYADDDAIYIETEDAKFTFPMKEKDIMSKPSKKYKNDAELIPGAKIVDFQIDDIEEDLCVPDGRYLGRSRFHLVDVEYVNKDGEIKTKKSLSYNPFLKTKLMGVLADSFIKRPGSYYEQIYRNYKARLNLTPKHYGKSAAHKHMMAKRYAVKMFLIDMWVVWRTIEGCEVSEPYAVAKLGMNPHGYNGVHDSDKEAFINIADESDD